MAALVFFIKKKDGSLWLVQDYQALNSMTVKNKYPLPLISSDFAIEAVLSQQSMTDGKWHPVVFYSKSLSSMERNYEIHAKEMLAIIHALEEWRHFWKELPIQWKSGPTTRTSSIS